MTIRHTLIFSALISMTGLAGAATIVKSDLDAHFAYRITGDRLAAPIQVFDNRGRTYLQLRNMDAPPVVFGEDGNALKYEIESPYIVLSDVYKGLVLRYGRNNEARISNVDFVAHKIDLAQGSVPTGKNVWFGGAKPARDTGGASSPVQSKTPAQMVAGGSSVAVSTSAAPSLTPLPQNAITTPPAVPAVASPAPSIITPPITIAKELATTGEFYVGNEPSEEVAPKRQVVSESNSVEFTIQSGRLIPVQTVRLSSLVERIGSSGVYTVSYVDARMGLKNGMQVRSRLIDLGVSPGSIRMSTSMKLIGDYIVVISGEKE